MSFQLPSVPPLLPPTSCPLCIFIIINNSSLISTMHKYISVWPQTKAFNMRCRKVAIFIPNC